MNPISKFGLVLLLCFLFSCDEKEETRLLYENILDGNERVIYLIKDKNENLVSWMNQVLADESKAKYIPIIHTLDSILSMTNKVQVDIDALRYWLTQTENNEVELGSRIVSVSNQMKDLEEDIESCLSTFLPVYADTFELREEEVQAQIELFNKHIQLKDTLLSNKHSCYSRDQIEILLSNATLKLAYVEYYISCDLTSLINMGCGWGYYVYPVVLPLTKSVKKGESFKAIILGLNKLEENFLYVDYIKVDGKELPLIDRRYVYYESEPLLEDSIFISIDCLIRNDATGVEFDPIEGYRYKIETE